VLFYGAALVACPAVADETAILFNVTIAYILYFYVCLMYNKAIKQTALTTNAGHYAPDPTVLRKSMDLNDPGPNVPRHNFAVKRPTRRRQ